MQGLTSDEVAERVSKGQVNDADVRTSCSYLDILIRNVATPFNVLLFILGIMLVICGELISAVSATGIIIVNILISTFQEMRAKRKLDKISLLVRPKVTVIRDGSEKVIDQSEIVLDDVIVTRAGEQALVDGTALSCRSVEMDESLLTGESSTVRKHEGDKVFSGSVCVTGELVYRAEAVGTDSYTYQMLKSAKRYTNKQTPLQMEAVTINKIMMVFAAIMFMLTVVKAITVTHASLGETLEILVVCIGVIPNGIFLLVTLTYLLASLRMANKGALLQTSNSVGSLSHVDTVCMDKTGTITTNRLAYEHSHDYMPSEQVARYASAFATLSGSRNRTMVALLEHYGESDAELIDEIQFSSERKYSAVKARIDGKEAIMYVGAITALRGKLASAEEMSEYISSESSKGLRTVLLCIAESGDLHDANGDPVLNPLVPVSVISISDQIRPDCRETIQVFLDNGMDLKVISGDDPVTVDALFSLADIPGERKIVSGPELDAMSEKEFKETVLEANIFGRMKPENKEKVIETLKRSGRYVAMIGDGVNDVKSLKTAQVGVSLESGAGAARGVADMVLVNDDFSALPKAIVEGRRTVSGMRDILKLYLTRNIVLAFLFVALYLIVGNIPMTPIQNTYYAFVSVTVIAFFMTIFAKPDENKELILPDVFRFCVPSAIMIAAFGLAVYGISWWAASEGILTVDFAHLAELGGYSSAQEVIQHMEWNGSSEVEVIARSAMLFFVTIAGILQMLLIAPRYKFLSIDGRTNKSLIPISLVVLVFLLVSAMYLFCPVIAIKLVGMVIFPMETAIVLLGVVVVWFFMELLLIRRNVFKHAVDRFESLYMQKLHEAYSDDEKEDQGS